MSDTNRGIGRRDFIASSLIGTIGLNLPPLASASPAQAAESAASPTGDTSIRKFNIDIPNSALDDLRRRIAATRWPDRETVSDTSQGVQLARLQVLGGWLGQPAPAILGGRDTGQNDRQSRQDRECFSHLALRTHALG